MKLLSTWFSSVGLTDPTSDTKNNAGAQGSGVKVTHIPFLQTLRKGEGLSGQLIQVSQSDTDDRRSQYMDLNLNGETTEDEG